MRKSFIMVPLVLALTACGSVKVQSGMELESKNPFASSGKTGDEVKYPSWYVQKNTDGALYSVATEYSKDMQFAVDKATLSAKRELASNYSSHVSSLMKDYTSESGGMNSDIMREIDRTTKLIVAQVNLIGVQRTNLEIRHEGEGYRAYVMMRYVTDESNKILLNEIRKNRQLNHKLAGSKSFRELESQVEKINSPTTEETQNRGDKPVSFKETFSDAVSNKPVVVN
jgi:hypothetical protein